MTTKTYAILDSHANGPFEIIQNGGTVLSCGTDASDIHRLTRGTIGFSSGVHYFEGTFYGEGEIVDRTSIGIVTALHPLSMYVGEDASGYGYLPGNGDVFSGGGSAAIASVDPTAKQITIGVLLDADANTVTFFVNNTAVTDPISITPGQVWYPAVGVGSTIAFDLSCFVQFGQDAFVFPQPGAPAWFTQTAGLGQLYFCDATGYLTMPDDVPADRSYDPRLLSSEQFSIQRTCSVWPWDKPSSGATYARLRIKNDDGLYDSLLTADARNARVTFRMVPEFGSYSDSFVVGTAVIDQVDTDGEAALAVTLQDTVVQLQRPLQRRKFPPYVDEGAANRPYPITLGACREVEPILVDEENRIFQIHDQPITNIAVLRGGGDRFDPNATPPDYVPTADLAGVQMQVLPTNKLTGDFSSVGQQYQIPGVDDVLAGDGLFTSWPVALSPPTGWTAGGTSGGFTRRGLPGWPQNYVAQLTTNDEWNPPSDIGTWLKYAGCLEAGKAYNITFKVFSVTGVPTPIGGLQFGLRVMSALDNDPASSITPYNQPIQQPLYRGDDQYVLNYTVPAGADRDLYFVVSSSQGVVGSASAVFYGIRLEELAEAAPAIPLQGITLTDFYQQIIETRAEMTPSDWVRQDAEDIDAATGYLYGYHVSEPVKIEDALRAPNPSSCSVLFTDWLGRLRVRRLIDPATVDDGDVALDIDMTNVLRPLNARVDRADGLTTAACAKFNYTVLGDSDFVSDFNPVTGIDAATRWQFKQQAQVQVSSTSPLAAYYEAAKQAPALFTLMDTAEEAQTEIDRVVALYSSTPRFFDAVVCFAPDQLEAFAQLIFGDVVRLTYDRYGLDSGRKAFVVNTQLFPADLRITLTLWVP